MSFQFCEYADVERPGTKLVSAKMVQVSPADTTWGVLFYAVVCAISPSLITKPPRLQLRVTLGSTNPTEGREHLRIAPSRGDHALQSFIIRSDGVEEVIGRSLDQIDMYPLKSMEGDIYFRVSKTPTQRILASFIEIID